MMVVWCHDMRGGDVVLPSFKKLFAAIGMIGLVGICGSEASDTESIELRTAPVEHWHYQLDWAVSSDDVLFGRIIDVDTTMDGGIAVTDGQLGNVLFFSEGGEFENRLHVLGEGPGKLSSVSGLACGEKGAVVVFQAFPARFERIACDGTPLSSHRVALDDDGFDLCVGLKHMSDGYLSVFMSTMYGAVAGGGDYRSVFTLRPLDGDLGPDSAVYTHEISGADVEGVVSEKAGYFPLEAWAALENGRYVIAPKRDEYRLDVFDAGGVLLRSYRRDVPQPLRSGQELELIRSRYAVTHNGVRSELDFDLYATAEMISGIVPLRGDLLALKTGFDADRNVSGRTVTYDLIDMEQRTCSPLVVDIPARPPVDVVHVLPDGDMVVATLVNSFLLPPEDDRGLKGPALQYWRRVAD